jgi:S1-C subfamily serine protease
MHSVTAARDLAPLLLLFSALILPAESPAAAPDDSSDPTAFLGVTVQELTPSIREALHLDEEVGVLVGSVVPGSPAEDAGIQVGDVLLRMNGEEMTDPVSLTQSVRALSPGQEASFVLLRNGKKHTVEAVLGTLGEPAQASPWRAMGLKRGAYLGVRMHDPDEDLARCFGTRPEEGVLILTTDPGSPALEAGIRGGDVIVSVDGTRTGTSEDLLGEVMKREPGEEIRVRFLRQGTEREIAVRLGEKSLIPWGGGRKAPFPPRPGALEKFDEDLRERMERLDREIDRLKEEVRKLREK